MAPVVKGDFDCGGVPGLEPRKSKGKRERQEVVKMRKSGRLPARGGNRVVR